MTQYTECYNYRLALHTQKGVFVVDIVLLCSPSCPQAHYVTQAGLKVVAVLALAFPALDL